MDSPDELTRVLAAADRVDRPVLILGGGSNLLVADTGYPGVVVRYLDDECVFHDQGCGDIVVQCAAGATWDDVVEDAVAREFAGIECLSGIPGLAGAAPMQNIGAYGQELAEVVTSVLAMDRADGSLHRLGADDCGFEYRHSRFKAEGRWIVVELQLHLRRGGAPTVRYPGLSQALDERVPKGRTAGLQDVRETVLRVRGSKSMVLSSTDPNRRSAGSFFTNPIVDPSAADAVEQAASRVAPGVAVPRWPVDDGRVKLSAAWLMEHAGFTRGYGEGAAGLSTNHCLALVNRGGARSADLIALAATVRRGVRDTFGVTLAPEPMFVGFEGTVSDLLDGEATP